MMFALKNLNLSKAAPPRASCAVDVDVDRPMLLLLALFAVAPVFLTGYFVGELTRAMIYGMAACAVGFAIRHGGLVSFGHAAFFGLGAYAVLIAHDGGLVEAVPVWGLALVVVVLAAAAIGALSLRTSGVSFIMITLGFAQVVYFLVSGNPALGAADGMPILSRDLIFGWSVESTPRFYYLTLGILVSSLFLMQRLSRSPAGLALRGITHDEGRVMALGYATRRLQFAAFVLSAAITGMAGVLAANYYRFASPSYLHWTISGEFLVMVALGGAASLSGGVFGAVVLIAFEVFLSEYTTYWRLFLGLAVIVSVLYFRRGIHPALNRLLGKSDA